MRARKRAATTALGVLALVWILAVAVPAVAGVYPADELALSGVDVSRAPVVSTLVHVPDEVELDPGTVRMQEDGKDVGGIRVWKAGEARAALGVGARVAVTVDVSGSMSGEPLEAAKEAARNLIRSLPANASVALLAFSDQVRLVGGRFACDGGGTCWRAVCGFEDGRL